MIFVGGVPFSTDPSPQGNNAVFALMEDPILVSVSNTFKAIPEKKFSTNEESSLERSNKWVYVFQREYATVNPATANFVGTDEATTCVGLVIRNRQNGMTSIAHMDSPDIVDMGICQMLSLLIDQNLDAELEVHMVGGFEDASPNYAKSNTRSESSAKLEGYSYPLCAKIVESLCTRREKFHVKTLFILGHNTRRDTQGNVYPIFNGLAVSLNLVLQLLMSHFLGSFHLN
ncbi:Protein N-terminal asparagine amidohydrolase [Morella rubra]|uniref:Protein N-terminal asparagine amidohydrolase n=1 Tax=Morella rubra TaxID=262757 RepID=A0A6A1WI69_9ROSI|nr:Protein N-terminal asparagine amidohydrolase [Morella rubra]